MMDLKAFSELVTEIQSQGYDRGTACRYASLLGDLPVRDTNGDVLVEDEQGKVIARLKPLKFYGIGP